MASASVGATLSRALQAHCKSSPESSFEASSSSSSSLRPAAEAEAEARPVPCDGGAEEDVRDLDSPWVSATEAQLRLEEAAMAAAAAALHLHAENEADSDEIRDNQQRQDDELMALEAIYGDDLAVLENKGRLQHFQIYIRYELHDGAEVCAKITSGNRNPEDGKCPNDDTEQHDNGQDELSYNCNFEYLPPLILTCLLPKSYPSKDPPYFTVTAKWMDEHNVSQLCEMLDIICYCSNKRHQSFLEEVHVCMICLNQSKGSNFIKLPCQHLFCVKCMETLCKMHVKEGSLFQLVCPDTKCNTSIPHNFLKRLLSIEEFERWDRLALEKALNSMADVVYCPKCEIGCLQDDDNNAQCAKCSFTFCGICKELWHPGKQCVTLEQKLQRQKASGKLTETEMAQQMVNIRELYKDVRLCPNCRVAIYRSEGCNKMMCTSCGQLFCFRCCKAITGYSHFKNCGLYEARDTTEWDTQMIKMQNGMQERAQKQKLGDSIRCPKCREKTFKDDEKYVFCWACRTSYCTLCKRAVEDKIQKRGHWGSPECVGLENM
ncbi:unnamed protein product [Alopecurus aequalis]